MLNFMNNNIVKFGATDQLDLDLFYMPVIHRDVGIERYRTAIARY